MSDKPKPKYDPGNQGTRPTLSEIREAHEAESRMISQAILQGDVEGLRVSKGMFSKMMSHLTQEEKSAQAKRRLDLSGAVRTFNRIAQGWKLTESETLRILGDPTPRDWEAWTSGSSSTIPTSILERISLVIGIYQMLRIIFPTEQQANDWVRRPNDYFDGRSALDMMLADGLPNVRKYLDNQKC